MRGPHFYPSLSMSDAEWDRVLVALESTGFLQDKRRAAKLSRQLEEQRHEHDDWQRAVNRGALGKNVLGQP